MTKEQNMKGKLGALITAALLFGTQSAASEHNRMLDLSMSCNENGAVLTLASGEVFYLGRSCDAAQKGGGTGKWWFAASAFLIEMDGRVVLRVPNEMQCDITYCLP